MKHTQQSKAAINNSSDSNRNYLHYEYGSDGKVQKTYMTAYQMAGCCGIYNVSPCIWNDSVYNAVVTWVKKMRVPLLFTLTGTRKAQLDKELEAGDRPWIKRLFEQETAHTGMDYLIGCYMATEPPEVNEESKSIKSRRQVINDFLMQMI